MQNFKVPSDIWEVILTPLFDDTNIEAESQIIFVTDDEVDALAIRRNIMIADLQSNRIENMIGVSLSLNHVQIPMPNRNGGNRTQKTYEDIILAKTDIYIDAMRDDVLAISKSLANLYLSKDDVSTDKHRTLEDIMDRIAVYEEEIEILSYNLEDAYWRLQWAKSMTSEAIDPEEFDMAETKSEFLDWIREDALANGAQEESVDSMVSYWETAPIMKVIMKWGESTV